MAIVAGVVVLLLGVGSAAAVARIRGSHEAILAGVTIDGVAVGGMTREQARAAVEARTTPLLNRHVQVAGGGRRWQVTPAGLGRRAEVEQAVATAMAGPHLSFFADGWHRLANRPVRFAVPLAYSDDDQRVAGFVRSLAPTLSVPPTDAGIKLVDGQVQLEHAKPGRALDLGVSTRALAAALRSGSDRVRLTTRSIAPGTLDSQLGKTIAVDTSANVLTVYDGLKVSRTFRVATAMAGYVTPAGSWKVVNKIANPTWHNPAPNGWGKGEPLVIPPGPGNPLGTRALYLNAPGIRFLGTYAAGSIGTHASHGCIRMRVADSEALYPTIPIGTPVLVHR